MRYIKYLLKVLVTPSCWLRNTLTCRKVERFYREIIKAKDRVEVVKIDGYHIIFKFKERYFRAWISNKYYGFLMELEEVKPNDRWPLDWLLVKRLNYIKGQPSRTTAFEFEDLFLPKPNHTKRDDSWLTLEK